eukprot:SM000010S04190  [mRNA]  locus=s10:94651:99424:- [translate_table: standard]
MAHKSEWKHSSLLEGGISVQNKVREIDGAALEPLQAGQASSEAAARALSRPPAPPLVTQGAPGPLPSESASSAKIGARRPAQTPLTLQDIGEAPARGGRLGAATWALLAGGAVAALAVAGRRRRSRDGGGRLELHKAPVSTELTADSEANGSGAQDSVFTRSAEGSVAPTEVPDLDGPAPSASPILPMRGLSGRSASLGPALQTAEVPARVQLPSLSSVARIKENGPNGALASLLFTSGKDRSSATAGSGTMKKEVVQRLRAQLKSRDELILDMQAQISERERQVAAHMALIASLKTELAKTKESSTHDAAVDSPRSNDQAAPRKDLQSKVEELLSALDAAGKELELSKREIEGRDRLVEAYERERLHLAAAKSMLEQKVELQGQELAVILNLGKPDGLIEAQSSNDSSEEAGTDLDEAAANGHRVGKEADKDMSMTDLQQEVEDLSNALAHRHQVSMEVKRMQVAEKREETTKLVAELQHHSAYIDDLQNTILNEESEEAGPVDGDDDLEGDKDWRELTASFLHDSSSGIPSAAEASTPCLPDAWSAGMSELSAKLQKVAMRQRVEEEMQALRQHEAKIASLRERVTSLRFSGKGDQRVGDSHLSADHGLDHGQLIHRLDLQEEQTQRTTRELQQLALSLQSPRRFHLRHGQKEQLRKLFTEDEESPRAIVYDGSPSSRYMTGLDTTRTRDQSGETPVSKLSHFLDGSETKAPLPNGTVAELSAAPDPEAQGGAAHHSSEGIVVSDHSSLDKATDAEELVESPRDQNQQQQQQQQQQPQVEEETLSFGRKEQPNVPLEGDDSPGMNMASPAASQIEEGGASGAQHDSGPGPSRLTDFMSRLSEAAGDNNDQAAPQEEGDVAAASLPDDQPPTEQPAVGASSIHKAQLANGQEQEHTDLDPSLDAMLATTLEDMLRACSSQTTPSSSSRRSTWTSD